MQAQKNWDFMILCIGQCAMLNTDIDRIKSEWEEDNNRHQARMERNRRKTATTTKTNSMIWWKQKNQNSGSRRQMHDAAKDDSSPCCWSTVVHYKKTLWSCKRVKLGENHRNQPPKKKPKILVQCHAPKKPMQCATKKTVESHRPAKMMFSAPVSSGLLQKTNTLSAMARKKQQEENWKISQCSRKKTKFHNASRKNCGIWQKASRLKTAIISTGKLKTCGTTGKFS